jgi:O-acetyl-ADP-ribose deacetylase (regulator of RNase III)
MKPWKAHHEVRGEVVPMPPCGSPYKAVLHAVGVDTFYDTSAEVVRTVVTNALQIAAEFSASKLALPAIATGYGRLSLTDFSEGIKPVMELPFHRSRRLPYVCETEMMPTHWPIRCCKALR